MTRASWWTALIGVCLVLLGVWGAWVPHRAAALVLSGWDLAELVKFLPGTSATRELFYLPIWCAGLALAVIAAEPSKGLAKRVFPTALALGLMLTLLPPYPHVLNGYQTAEFRWRFLLGVSGLLLVLGVVAVSWLLASDKEWPVRAVGAVLLALALLGALPALWQYLEVRGAIQAVYGAQLGWGRGLALFLIGWTAIGAVGGRLLIRGN